MSFQAVCWALEDAPVQNATERLVLIALANYADERGRCHPAVFTLARLSLLSERGVQKVLRRLEEGEIIATEAQVGPLGTNAYRLNLPADRLRLPPTRAGVTAGKKKGGEPRSGEGERGGERGGERRGEPGSPEPLNHYPLPSTPLSPPPGGSEAAAPKPKATRKAPEAPGRLPEGWEPTPTARLFAEAAGLPVERLVREFRSYWQQRGDPKTPRGWEQAFANRVRMLHGQGLDAGKKLPPLPDWAECAKRATVRPAADGGPPQAGGDLTSREREILRLCDLADDRSVRLEKLPSWFGSPAGRPPLGECMDEADRWIRAACARLQRPLPPFVPPEAQPALPGMGGG